MPTLLEDEIEYITRDDVNIAILREMAKIKFRERIQIVMIWIIGAELVFVLTPSMSDLLPSKKMYY